MLHGICVPEPTWEPDRQVICHERWPVYHSFFKCNVLLCSLDYDLKATGGVVGDNNPSPGLGGAVVSVPMVAGDD